MSDFVKIDLARIGSPIIDRHQRDGGERIEFDYVLEGGEITVTIKYAKEYAVEWGYPEEWRGTAGWYEGPTQYEPREEQK